MLRRLPARPSPAPRSAATSCGRGRAPCCACSPCTAGQDVHRERLVDLLWSDGRPGPRNARAAGRGVQRAPAAAPGRSGRDGVRAPRRRLPARPAAGQPGRRPGLRAGASGRPPARYGTARAAGGVAAAGGGARPLRRRPAARGRPGGVGGRRARAAAPGRGRRCRGTGCRRGRDLGDLPASAGGGPTVGPARPVPGRRVAAAGRAVRAGGDDSAAAMVRLEHARASRARLADARRSRPRRRTASRGPDHLDGVGHVRRFERRRRTRPARPVSTGSARAVRRPGRAGGSSGSARRESGSWDHDRRRRSPSPRHSIPKTATPARTAAMPGAPARASHRADRTWWRCVRSGTRGRRKPDPVAEPGQHVVRRGPAGPGRRACCRGVEITGASTSSSPAHSAGERRRSAEHRRAGCGASGCGVGAAVEARRPIGAPAPGARRSSTSPCGGRSSRSTARDALAGRRVGREQLHVDLLGSCRRPGCAASTACTSGARPAPERPAGAVRAAGERVEEAVERPQHVVPDLVRARSPGRAVTLTTAVSHDVVGGRHQQPGADQPALVEVALIRASVGRRRVAGPRADPADVVAGHVRHDQRPGPRRRRPAWPARSAPGRPRARPRAPAARSPRPSPPGRASAAAAARAPWRLDGLPSAPPTAGARFSTRRDVRDARLEHPDLPAGDVARLAAAGAVGREPRWRPWRGPRRTARACRPASRTAGPNWTSPATASSRKCRSSRPESAKCVHLASTSCHAVVRGRPPRRQAASPGHDRPALQGEALAGRAVGAPEHLVADHLGVHHRRPCRRR